MSALLDGMADLLFQDTQTGLLILDGEGWVVRANEAVTRMTALPLNQIEGWPALMLVGLPYRAMLKAGLAEAADAVLGLRIHGTGLDIGLEATAMRDADGAVTGHLLRLRGQPSARQAASGDVNGQKLHSLGHLTAAVAHDFSNLVGAMLAAAGMLEQSAMCRDDAESRDMLAELRGSAMRGKALVGRLLGYGRPAEEAPRELDVDAAVADLADMLRRLFPRAIRLALDLRAGAARVRADPTRLDQVLVNLAINARDAMPDGGTLSIRTERRVLEQALDAVGGRIPPGPYVVTEMADTGTGIAAHILPRIFAPFFTTRHEQGGNGLGLSTVREIVGAFGGFLDVRSAPGGGTCMRVYLPCLNMPAMTDRAVESLLAAPASAPASSPPPAFGAGRGTVLLVEDELALARLADLTLRRGGWRVLLAASAEAALALADASRPGAGRPTVLVTDIALPDMNGWVLAHAVRQRLGAPALPVVLTSGFSGRGLAVEMARLGAGAVFLAKPYTLEQLATALEPFAHGPGPIDVSASFVNSALDEHITNKTLRGGPRAIALEASDVTDSGGDA